MKKLAIDNNATNLRLWGKILGTEKDYYIVEGTAEDPAAQAEPPADFEARGQGVNTYAYWVSNSPMGPWTALEDLNTSDLAAARTIKIQFSGNLERSIVTNPFYFRKEKHFLRAQIARITMATTLVPATIYRFQEESTTEIELNEPEDGVPRPCPSSEEMEKKDMWLHYTRNILKCNRITHMDPVPPEEPPENYDPEEEVKKMIAADPFEARLKPITQDKSCKGNYPAWVLRSYGDKTDYAAANPAVIAAQNYRVVFVKSTVWPGAQSYFSQGSWGQIYVGNGLKHENTLFYPVNPPQIIADPVERPTYKEPNGQVKKEEPKEDGEAKEDGAE